MAAKAGNIDRARSSNTALIAGRGLMGESSGDDRPLGVWRALSISTLIDRAVKIVSPSDCMRGCINDVSAVESIKHRYFTYSCTLLLPDISSKC